MGQDNIIFVLIGLIMTGGPLSISQDYQMNEGSVFFRSDAPLELIEARSDEMLGVIRPGEQRFAFSIPISTFEGFNNPLQQVHFNENYMESDEFPEATFSGRIIESVDWTEKGTHDVRAKGILNIHGVKQERIIKGTLRIGEGGSSCNITARFTVLLDEHDIQIPKIVTQKIAEEISVEIEAEFEQK